MPRYGDIGDFLQATIALIAIANPFAALPVFLLVPWMVLTAVAVVPGRSS